MFQFLAGFFLGRFTKRPERIVERRPTPHAMLWAWKNDSKDLYYVEIECDPDTNEILITPHGQIPTHPSKMQIQALRSVYDGVVSCVFNYEQYGYKLK
jgi:hypothetical protein